MKKFMKYFSKSLAILLSLLTIISVVPMQAFATDYQNYVTLTSVEEPVEEEFIIQSEVIDERDAYSKTYLLADGTYCSVTSILPLHELVEGEWENVNPEINETTPETVDDALTLLTYEQNISTYTSVDDGYTKEDTLSITLNKVDENNNVTTGSVALNDTTFGVVNVDVFNQNRVYNKTEVTIDADLKLNCNVTASSYVISVQPIYSSWKDVDGKYDTLVEEWENNPIIDYNNIDSGGRYVWDITSEYIKYENGTYENYGFLLSTEQSSSVVITSGFVLRHYRIIDDNDLGFTYHTVDMGRAGIVYINDFTNTFYLEREELSLDGYILPVSLTRFIENMPYNSSFAAGGRWNYESRLIESSDTYIWNMFNGSSARFQIADGETDSENREKWEEYAYNSQGYTLWVDADKSRTYDYSNNIIIDDEGYTYAFNEYGLVETITSPNNDLLSIEYNGETITRITDGVGREYILNYTSENDINIVSSINVKLNNEQIKIITDEIDGDSFVSANVEMLYEYQIINDTPYLSKAKYSDGKFVEYTYDSVGRLLSVKNIDGSILGFSYSINPENTVKSKNPAYYSRISSYSKKVLNANNEYEIDFTVNIDAQNSYRRVFTQINNLNEVVLTETIQYNRNLDVLYMTNDPIGDAFYADYDDTHQLLSLVIPENAKNLVVNGDMSSWKRGNKVPKEWNIVGISDQSGSSDIQRDGNSDNYYVSVVNSLSVSRMLTQTVTLDNAKSGDKYVISAWGLSGATLPREEHFWGVRILAKNSDNEEVEIHSMPFDASLWNVEQTRLTAFSLPFDTDEITIQLVSSQQLGDVAFDNICLYKTESAYVAAVDDAESVRTCICEGCEYANCTCTHTDTGSCDCVSCNVKTTNEKVDNKEIITTTNGSKSLISQYTYTTDLNYPLQYIDENNISTSYEYSLTNESMNGLILSEKTDENATVHYGYDAIGMLTSVSQTVTNVINKNQVNMNTTYSYENDKISSISHNGFSYNYEYDIYGNVKSISVEDKTLLTYSYNNDHNRSIGAITYGNGKKLSYTYDGKGNITEIYIDNENTPKYEYEYDVYNNLVTYTDHANNTITSYNKTIGEKTYEIVVQRIDDAETIIYSIEAGSDSSYVESVFGRDYSISKTISYDSATGNSTAIATTPVILFNEGGKATVTTTSDSLDRRIEEKLKFTTDVVDYQNASIEVKNEYTYKNVDSSQTTRLIETFKATLITTDENGISTPEELINLKYKYDSAGRITTIYEYRLSGVSGYYHPIALYKYDDAGQLIAEAHGYSNEVWGYTYDAGGNITSKNKLNYNDVIVEDVENPDFKNLDKTTPLKTITYDYHDTYKDLLVSFDDETISYDDAGNPLNYHGYTIGGETSMNFSWAGRNLVEAVTQDGDSKFKYTYDASGIRTKKEIYEQESFTIATTDANGNPTTESKSEFIKTCAIEYVWSNGMIVAQKVSTYSPVEDENGYYVMNDKEVAVVENDDSIIVKPLYNDFNEPLGVNCYITTEDGEQSETFYFIKDAQDNIRSIYSMENDYTINMNYDAFGNYSLDLSGDAIDEMQNSIINANGELNQTLAKIVVGIAMTVMVCITFTAAPHSYRGYIYDIETGLYYCQSRYYSPSWGRFINADDVTILEMTAGEVHGANIFAYCNNDPVNYIDSTGYFPTSWIIAAVDLLIIAVPAIFSANQILKKGKVAATIFSKISDDLAEIVAKVLLKRFSRKTINMGILAIEKIGSIAKYFSKISIGVLVEYIIDCLDGKRNHDLDTTAKLKFRLIL